MRHHGIQEECSDEENEHSLMKYMTQDSEEKPERRSGQGRPPKRKALPDGTLHAASLQRVNNMLVTMQNESAKMTEELTNAKQSCVIGPAVITACTAAKTKFDDAIFDLRTYKDNNKEGETGNILKDAKQSLLEGRKQFTIVRKILNLRCPVSHSKDVIVNVDL